jgi:hypothetical protein
MSRWYGKIGFSVQEETSPGIWNEVVVEKNYYGDISNRSRRWQQGQDLLDDITITNEIIITTDPYIIENLTNIRYVEIMGIKWKITNITLNAPRLTLSLGGIYNAYQS